MANPESGYEIIPNVTDPVRSFIEHLPVLGKAAKEALDGDAYSYRKFFVSCALFAYDATTRSAAYFARGNTKLRPHAKICAETKAQGKNAQTPFGEIVGLYVRGTTDVEKIRQVNNIRVPTLWPCQDVCVPDLTANPRTSDNLLVVTTGLGRRKADGIYQAHTLDDIKRMYKTGSWVTEGQQTGYDLDSSVAQRLAIYDTLVASEATLPSTEQRSYGELGRMALMVPLL